MTEVIDLQSINGWRHRLEVMIALDDEHCQYEDREVSVDRG